METTLYDQKGQPVAYIADDGETIYLWDGRAVAYLHDGDKVYGWNGQHLGWYIGGTVYDLDGRRVGFIRSACPVTTFVEPVKYVKHTKYVKYVRHVAYTKSVLSTGFSDKDLREFLSTGGIG